MQCLKCGKTTKDEQVFCSRCLTAMESYPVKPDVHIQLPNRPDRTLVKKAGRKRRPLSAEEQVAYLRSRQRRLVAAIVLLAVLLCAAGVVLVHNAIAPDNLEWGTNYTFDNPFG